MAIEIMHRSIVKYIASKGYRALVLSIQEDEAIDIFVISGVLHSITTDMELIIGAFNGLAETKRKETADREEKESIFKRISDQFVRILEMTIDARIAADDFQRQLALFFQFSPKEVGRIFPLLQKFHELYLRQGESFDEIISHLALEKIGQEKYSSAIKHVLGTHIQRIIQVLKDERDKEYLRNPLYIQALQDVARLRRGKMPEKPGRKREASAGEADVDAECLSGRRAPTT